MWGQHTYKRIRWVGRNVMLCCEGVRAALFDTYIDTKNSCFPPDKDSPEKEKERSMQGQWAKVEWKTETA